MKRIVIVAMFLLIVTALAGIARPDGARAVAGQSDTGSVTVSGTGSVSSTPDRAEISAGVETSAPSARAALADNATAMTRVIDALKRAGATNVTTESVSLSPRTTQSGEENGYIADNTVLAVLPAGAAGRAIDAAADAGANVVSGPSLTIGDARTLYRQALKAAVADARDSAEALAAASGRTLGEVTTISESGAAPVPWVAKTQAGAADSTPIEPGEQQTSATVSVTFELR